MEKRISLKKEMIDDISNNRTFSIVTYSVLGAVSFLMTVLNIVTQKGFLTVATGIFALLCLINIFLTMMGSIGSGIAKVLFSIEILCMFSFFLVSGNPDGFSAIWICMLPSLGMVFFNRIRGTVLCVAMFFVLVFFLWIPYGQGLLQYEYNPTFRMRFPILFVAFHALAFLLETLRVSAFNQMKQMRAYYQELSVRDPLTGVLNRQGMYSALEQKGQSNSVNVTGVAMFDVDHFKEVNDLHGHNAGDTVLKDFSAAICSRLKGIVCRWGGEEFVVIFFDGDVSSDQLHQVKDAVEQMSFTSNGETFHITTSIGVCLQPGFVNTNNIDALIGKADEALYRAKSTGRNKVVYYHEDDSSV